jgi:hypothetical protein
MIIPQWPAPDNVKALATERELTSSSSSAVTLTGISLPPYQSLNLGDHVNDLPEYVSSNRQQLVNYAKGCDEIRWLQQIHGIDCPDANSITHGAKADASFTQTLGLACTVMTADCLPVLFCDLQGRQVAAAHAGWKGLAQGVLLNTLKSFNTNNIPANQVIAWMGPAISPAAFEVGPEVKDIFDDVDSAWVDEACFKLGERDRLQANLYRLARRQLEKAGIAGVYGGGVDENGIFRQWCTFSDKNESGEGRFFSYRRQPITGRQASLVWLEK